MLNNITRWLAVFFVFGLISVIFGQELSYDKVFEGALEVGDEQLETNEYADTYSISLKKGQEVSFYMTSHQIKTYLFVVGPDGKQYDIGDYSEDDAALGSSVELTLAIAKSGKYEITATSLNEGEVGSYSVGVTIAKGVYNSFSKGSLAVGDKQFDDDSYYDVTEFNFKEGERVVIAVSSANSDDGGFDTYLIVKTPDGQSLENDDYPEGNSALSRVEFIALKTGTYVVKISSYDAEETGDYILAVGHKKP